MQMKGDDATCPEIVVRVENKWTISIRHEIVQPDDDVNPLLSLYYLRPSAVKATLEKTWMFANEWWNISDPYQRHDVLFGNTVLYNWQGRFFREQATNRIPWPSGNNADPWEVFDEPRQLSRGDLESPDAEIARLLKKIELKMRDANSP